MLWTSTANFLYLIQQIITSKTLEKSGWWINHEQNGLRNQQWENMKVPLTKKVLPAFNTKTQPHPIRRHKPVITKIFFFVCTVDEMYSICLAFSMLQYSSQEISNTSVPWVDVTLLEHVQTGWLYPHLSLQHTCIPPCASHIIKFLSRWEFRFSWCQNQKFPDLL